MAKKNETTTTPTITTTTTTPEVPEVETSKAIVLTGNFVPLRTMLPEGISHPQRTALVERLQEAHPQGVMNLGRGDSHKLRPM
jgi:hypothetical protein